MFPASCVFTAHKYTSIIVSLSLKVTLIKHIQGFSVSGIKFTQSRTTKLITDVGEIMT